VILILFEFVALILIEIFAGEIDILHFHLVGLVDDILDPLLNQDQQIALLDIRHFAEHGVVFLQFFGL
jgi:hypothetical protein